MIAKKSSFGLRIQLIRSYFKTQFTKVWCEHLYTDEMGGARYTKLGVIVNCLKVTVYCLILCDAARASLSLGVYIEQLQKKCSQRLWRDRFHTDYILSLIFQTQYSLMETAQFTLVGEAPEDYFCSVW